MLYNVNVSIKKCITEIKLDFLICKIFPFFFNVSSDHLMGCFKAKQLYNYYVTCRGKNETLHFPKLPPEPSLHHELAQICAENVDKGLDLFEQ